MTWLPIGTRVEITAGHHRHCGKSGRIISGPEVCGGRQRENQRIQIVDEDGHDQAETFARPEQWRVIEEPEKC